MAGLGKYCTGGYGRIGVYIFLNRCHASGIQDIPTEMIRHRTAIDIFQLTRVFKGTSGIIYYVSTATIIMTWKVIKFWENVNV